jgi:hypothetical protein
MKAYQKGSAAKLKKRRSRNKLRLPTSTTSQCPDKDEFTVASSLQRDEILTEETPTTKAQSTHVVPHLPTSAIPCIDTLTADRVSSARILNDRVSVPAKP